MPSIAEPAPKFRWPAAVGRIVAVSGPKIWEVISNPGSLPLYHPFCEKNPVMNWPGADSHDEVHYFNGVILERRFTNWYDDVGYDLEIGRAGGRKSVVSWRITPIEEQRSSIEIAIYPHAVQSIPITVRWIPHLFWLQPHLRRYLQSVVKGLDLFITSGRPVKRNQFGDHPWFSPPTDSGGGRGS
jgi:hypothetical protein